jgi:hypothetical protein
MRRDIGLKNRTFVLTMIFAFLALLPACSEDTDLDPVLKTIQAADADITSTAAKLKGEITVLGTKDIVEYGIELSKSQLFSAPVRKFYNTPAVVGTFEVDFTGLDPNTLYYYRVYVVINTAHVYSQESLHFTTKN